MRYEKQKTRDIKISKIIGQSRLVTDKPCITIDPTVSVLQLHFGQTIIYCLIIMQGGKFYIYTKIKENKIDVIIVIKFEIYYDVNEFKIKTKYFSCCYYLISH
jgi:hypothetical protein